MPLLHANDRENLAIALDCFVSLSNTGLSELLRLTCAHFREPVQ